jgi:hypothetical protein
MPILVMEYLNLGHPSCGRVIVQVLTGAAIHCNLDGMNSPSKGHHT